MQNNDVKQTKTNPSYFRGTVSESSPSPPPQKKKTQLHCDDTRIITWNKERVCMQTTHICQAHLCKGQNTKTLQVFLDQMKKGH